MQELGIRHKQIESVLVAFMHFNLKERSEIHAGFKELAQAMPAGNIIGAPYCVIQFFSSFTEGFEVEVGFPVRQAIETDKIHSKPWPGLEVLSMIHTGPPGELRTTKVKLYEFTGEHGLISDEFTREVYPEWEDTSGPIEVQFVIHNWNAIFARNLERVLGKKKRDRVMESADQLSLESTPLERFEWAKGAMQCLDELADEDQKFDVVSSCSHIYPPLQLDKLREVYQNARLSSTDPFEAVDEVIAFMRSDPGWGEKDMVRQGNVIYHTKNPADPQAYKIAQTPEEKRAAYCFCPIIRIHLDRGISDTYCYCGSGWYRQQWQAATGMPVTVKVVQSVVRGDEVCQFAAQLSKDL
jgi:effector-binding domain-containing protein